MAGEARTDNRKYKDTFHKKAKMIPFDQVEDYIGHALGGVCPFAVKDNVKVYLDQSGRISEKISEKQKMRTGRFAFSVM